MWSSVFGDSVLVSAFCGLFVEDGSTLVPFPPREVDRLPELIFTNTMYTYYLQCVLLLKHMEIAQKSHSLLTVQLYTLRYNQIQLQDK